MRLLLGIAVRNLIQARRRTMLLSAAIGIVTALLVLLLSLAQGIEDNLIESATTLTTGHVNVAGFYKPTVSQAGPMVTGVPKLRAIVEENTPDLDYIVSRTRGWAKLVSDTSSTQSALQGLSLAEETRFVDTLRLAPEEDYVEGGGLEVKGDVRGLEREHTIVLFASQAKRLDVGVGDVITIQTETSGGRTNTIDATVVAVGKDLGLLSSFVTFVPTPDLHELYQTNDDTTGALQIYLKDIDRSEAVMGHLREVLLAEGYELIDHQAAPFFAKFETVAGEDWMGQKLDVTTWEDEVSFLTWVITAFHTVSWFLVLVLLAIIAVGITNALWTAVRERTREIGTMRAIGMTRRRVLALILFEALLLGLFATLAGSLLGTVTALSLDAAHIVLPLKALQAILLSDTLHLSVQPWSVAFAVVLLSLLTAGAAIWPARRAASLRPVTAIQTVD